MHTWSNETEEFDYALADVDVSARYKSHVPNWFRINNPTFPPNVWGNDFGRLFTFNSWVRYNSNTNDGECFIIYLGEYGRSFMIR